MMLLLLLVAGGLIAILLGDEIARRLFGGDEGSAAARVPLMVIAWRMIVDQPLLGVGVNNFTEVMLQYADMDRAGIWLFAVHNKYLLVWAEIGVFGFLAFVWFLVATVRRGWQTWRSQDPQLSLMALGFTAGIAGHAVQMCLDIFRNRASVQVLWTCAALVAVMSSLVRDNRLPSRNSEWR